MLFDTPTRTYKQSNTQPIFASEYWNNWTQHQTQTCRHAWSAVQVSLKTEVATSPHGKISLPDAVKPGSPWQTVAGVRGVNPSEIYNPTYCWWKKSCTSWWVLYTTIYRVLYIPGGAGLLPSTVAFKPWRHPRNEIPKNNVLRPPLMLNDHEAAGVPLNLSANSASLILREEP